MLEIQSSGAPARCTERRTKICSRKWKWRQRPQPSWGHTGRIPPPLHQLSMNCDGQDGIGDRFVRGIVRHCRPGCFVLARERAPFGTMRRMMVVRAAGERTQVSARLSSGRASRVSATRAHFPLRCGLLQLLLRFFVCEAGLLDVKVRVARGIRGRIRGSAIRLRVSRKSGGFFFATRGSGENHRVEVITLSASPSSVRTAVGADFPFGSDCVAASMS